jgi:hypothetical protein
MASTMSMWSECVTDILIARCKGHVDSIGGVFVILEHWIRSADMVGAEGKEIRVDCR